MIYNIDSQRVTYMAKPKRSNLDTGRLGEDIVTEYLQGNGVRILERNIRTEYGEIDILGEEGDCLVFAEVKTRRTKRFGFPETSVNISKQTHMTNSAIAYLQETDNLNRTWRIDVISVNMSGDKKPVIEWFKNAITS